MVTEAIYGDRATELSVFVARSSGALSGFAVHLDDAFLLAKSDGLEPDWDIVLHDRSANLERIVEKLRVVM
jgi:hypothetical protein